MTKKVIETTNGWYMENEKAKVELEDIVGLVQTDDSTNSVQLKKEAQLSICEQRVIELEKENEQLKQAYTQLKHRHSLLHDVCIDAECDRDSYHKDIASLEKENEQLKNRVDELEDDNMKYTLSTDKLEGYTKRFMPTKCINEFRDCKTNRYYWLDNEDNFTGTLELLNLLDCEKEQLKQRIKELRKEVDALSDGEADWLIEEML